MVVSQTRSNEVNSEIPGKYNVLGGDLEPVNTKVCDTCRKRRVKCDKELPSCQRCVKGGYLCTYLNIPKKVWNDTKAVSSKQNQSQSKEHVQFKSLRPKNEYINTEFSSSPTEYNGSLSLVNGKHKNMDSMLLSTFSQNSLRPNLMKFSTKIKLIYHLLNESDFFIKRRELSMTAKGILHYSPPPLGVPLLMYTLYNRQNKYVTMDELEAIPAKTAAEQEPNLNHLDIYDTSGRLKINEVAKRCIYAYFKFYHPFTNLFNKRSFLTHLDSQSPALVYLVCSFGSGYLIDVPPPVRDFYGQKAIQIFNSRFLNTDLATLTCLILFSNFQHDPKDYNRAYFYMGLAIRMSYLLNLDREPKFMSEEVLEWRRKLWMWCHVMDKFYYFGLNRPCTHDFFFSQPQLPQNYQLDVVNFKDGDEACMGQATLVYNRFLVELCKLKYLMMLRFKFIDTVNQADLSDIEALAKTTGHHLEKWLHKVRTTFANLNQKYPDYNSEASSSFLLMLELFYYAATVQLYQTYTKLSTPHKAYFMYQCEAASTTGIQLVHQYRKVFNFCGNTYKFYALSTLVLFQVNLAKDATDVGVAYQAKRNITDALQVLTQSKNYYAIPYEICRVVESLLKTEGIGV